MKKTLILSGIVIFLTAFSLGYFIWFQPDRGERKVSAENTESPQTRIAENTVVAPGVVEAVSEEIEIGAELPGKLERVLVEEGDEVLKGQTIAVLENADYRSRISESQARIEILRRQKATAEARLRQSRADRERIFNGARREERVEAKRNSEQIEPEVAQAKNELERRRRLFDSGDVSREDFERARRNYETALRQSETLRARFDVVNADARGDDLEKAEAAVGLAETQVREFDALIREAETSVRTAEANFDKTIIRSPMTGVILRKRLKDGESVTPESEFGVVTVADVSALRVRVDLDETDVAKVREGQSAYIKADAYGEREFAGRIVKIGQILGRKNFRTERPTEKVDTKILEVLVELAPGQKLPLGLRVDVFISGD